VALDVTDWKSEAAGAPALIASTWPGSVEVCPGAMVGFSSDSMTIRIGVSS
jgi:hypothetical protein